VSTTMTDDHGSTNGAHGGVGHLLRMAKTQCGVSLAFAALRKSDGGFAIATFPTLAADPTWSVDAIDELVRQTWEDPHLTGGSVLVRSGRVLKGMWTGQGHHIKLAAAALSDPEAPEHPWGLLCVAEPLAGHFEQDQLNLLGNLAVRLTSYLRARQQVLEGSLGFERQAAVTTAPEEPTAPPFAPTYEQVSPVAPVSPVSPDFVMAEPIVAPWSSEPNPFASGDEFANMFDEFAEEHPLDQAAAATTAGAPWETGGREPRPDDWEFLGLDEIEWVEAAAPIPVPPAESVRFEPPAPAGVPEAPFAPPMSFGTGEAAAPASSTFGTREDPPVIAPASVATGVGALDELLGPDPVTGLATLTTLVGRLSASLAHVRNNEGTVGLIVVDVAPMDPTQPLSTTSLMTVAGRLTNHLRERDLVARIGPSLFAVLVDLRPGSIELEAIRERTIATLTAGIESSSGGVLARSALASAGAGSTVTAEELLRQAADQLPGR